MLTELKRSFISHAANIVGWKTKRKIVVIISDDWGTIRTASRAARTEMEKAGLNMRFFFDKYDALEDPNDLAGLYDVLTSVKDKNGNHAIFTPYALSANPDFDKMEKTGFKEYFYEPVPVTFNKLNGYEKAWELWQEGIKSNIFMPQFHGREHMNVKIMMEGLRANNPEMISCVKNRSWAGITTKGYLSTYGFENREENENHKKDLKEGIILFESIYGYKPTHFVPPQGKYSRTIEPSLKDLGINFIDVPRIKYETQLNGQTKKLYTYLGKKNAVGQKYIVRNCMFENVHKGNLNWVDFCLLSVDAAFRMNSPAIITTHRVNYIGHIEPSNRDEGLKGLKKLLTTIILKWPNVEFMSVEELGALMNKL